MLNPKPIIIAACCAIAIVVGVYLVGRYNLEQRRIPDIETPASPSVASTTAKKASVERTTPAATSQSHMSPEKTSQRSPEEIEAANRAFWESLGLEPPPPGYVYFGESPNHVLWPENEPYARAWYSDDQRYGQFHQLTEEEHVRYIILESIANTLDPAEQSARTELPSSLFAAYPKEVITLAKQRQEALYKLTYGPSVMGSSSVAYSREITKADRERENAAEDAKMLELEPRLFDTPEPSSTARKEVLTELFAAVGLSYQQYLEDKRKNDPESW